MTPQEWIDSVRSLEATVVDVAGQSHFMDSTDRQITRLITDRVVQLSDRLVQLGTDYLDEAPPPGPATPATPAPATPTPETPAQPAQPARPGVAPQRAPRR